MWYYLLKSGLCLLLFIGFYKIALEPLRMHHFKRFYLLISLVLAFSIPVITFTSYIEVDALPEHEIIEISIEEDTQETGASSFITWGPKALWILYGLGVLLFSLRFMMNLFKLHQKIKQNDKHRNHSFINVLLFEPTTPHTFLNYIFLNKQNFETAAIPKEVIWHEEAHARQKHSLDILFMELLQIVLWFHPMIYWFKNCIRLNHEFLADDAVLQQGVPSSNYQSLLLAFSSNAHTTTMAHAINYSSIKKRFTVMKTQRSKKANWLRSLLLLPLLSITLYSFSNHNTVEIPKQTSQESPQTLTEINVQEGATKAQVKEYNDLASKYNSMDPSNMTIYKSDVQRLKELYHLMSESQRRNAEPFPDFPEPPAEPVAITIVETPPPPPPVPANATPAQKAKYKKVMEQYKKGYPAKVVERKQDGKLVEVIEIISPEDAPPPPPAPAPITPKAKVNRYHEIIVEHKEHHPALKHLKEEHSEPNAKGEHSTAPHAQKLPPPPPPPKSALDQIQRMAKKKATFYYNGKKVTAEKAMQITKKNSKHLKLRTINGDSKKPIVYITDQPHIENKEMPKPTASNIINHIKVMNRHGSKFYLDNTQVTYKEALKYVRKNKDANVRSSLDTHVVIIESK